MTLSRGGAVFALALLAAGCTDTGGDDDTDTGTDTDTTDTGTDTGTEPPTATFRRVDLVSDEDGVAQNVDPNLINPWGLAYGPDTYFWVANEGSGTSTLYDGDGVDQSDAIGGPVQILDPQGQPAHPTGLVYNSTNGFEIAGDGGESSASTFLFVTTDGTIQGWNETSDAAIIANQGQGAYLGAALADTLTRAALYVTDFANGTIEVFDRDFQRPDFLTDGAFEDAGVPDGYAPFGVAVIDQQVYVTWAQVADSGEEEETGAGLGYVNVFDLDGTLVDTVATGGDLNAPWAVVRAPDSWGDLGGALLVGNFGDGTIAAYDFDTHEPMGLLQGDDGEPIAIEGLWGLAFGNGSLAGDADDLYFTAGPNDEAGGLFGVIRAAGAGGTDTDPGTGPDPGTDTPTGTTTGG